MDQDAASLNEDNGSENGSNLKDDKKTDDPKTDIPSVPKEVSPAKTATAMTGKPDEEGKLGNKDLDLTPKVPYKKQIQNPYLRIPSHYVTPHTNAHSHDEQELSPAKKVIPTPKAIAFDDTSGTKNLKEYQKVTIYHSSYLDDSLKPTNDKLTLTPDQEPLRQLILSQPEAFTKHIKELSDINLTISKQIEKKKNSIAYLSDPDKVPRSLHIKCALTASPAYANNAKYLQLKEDLATLVKNFTTKGSYIMQQWTTENIQLLIQDRNAHILVKALQILEGLTSFHIEVIGKPHWPSTPVNLYPLFLLKIYLSNNYIKIDDILEYLETTKETLLQLGTKILADSDSEEDINDIITSIKLTDFDPDDETQSNFIMETLWHFDQILKISTIEVWLDYQTRYKQLLAAENLKAKMLALNTVNATMATATAIMKATNNIQQAQDADLNTSLRISNLEKLSKKQEQRSNEILNKLKGTKIAKNFQGGLELESPVSDSTATNRTIPSTTHGRPNNRKGRLPQYHDRPIPDTYTPKELEKTKAYQPARKIDPVEKRRNNQFQPTSASNYIPTQPLYNCFKTEQSYCTSLPSTTPTPSNQYLQYQLPECSDYSFFNPYATNLPYNSNPECILPTYTISNPPIPDNIPISSNSQYTFTSANYSISNYQPSILQLQSNYYTPEHTPTKPLPNLIQRKQIAKSRRITQRRMKRLKHRTNLQQINEIKNMARKHISKANNTCFFNYGFCSNPEATITTNFNNAINHIQNKEHLQPKNLAFHNLCQTQQIPTGTRQLLGLNLKFCLASNKLPNNIQHTMTNLAHSIRNNQYLKTNPSNNNTEYIKQIYIKNKKWKPPPASNLIEEQLTVFEKAIKSQQQKHQNSKCLRSFKNLTTHQLQTLKTLQKNTNFIIKPTDKNLGPAIMDTTQYIQQVLKEHLLTTDYKQLTHLEAKNRMEKIQSNLKQIININQDQLTAAELLYFQRSFSQHHRLPIFYGLPKVHNNPTTLRPVVSSVNGFLSIFSNWLDYKMKTLVPLVHSYIKNSTDIIKDLKHLRIPHNAHLFSADAKSMYTNIDSPTGITALRDFISDNATQLPSNFPTELFLSVLRTVMDNNIFSFSDTFWQQLSGTAMGTPSACAYATVSFGQHENKHIIPNFKHNLIYYKRYIDDIFGIWLPPKENATATWNRFKETLNSWGKLEWVIEEPSWQTNFLDLHLEIHGPSIDISTYQKPMNLYLYIPPLSAHPPSCFKGLITGELKRYWLQNDTSNFQNILVKFIERLHARGHSIENLMPLLYEAAAITDKPPTLPAPKNSNENLYIHWRFHPKGLQRQHLRYIHESTLAPYLDYDNMTVAISRPKNLRDLLTSAKLKIPPHLNVQDIINTLTSQENSSHASTQT